MKKGKKTKKLRKLNMDKLEKETEKNFNSTLKKYKKHLIILLFVLVAISIIAFLLSFYISEIKSIPIEFEVGNYVGIIKSNSSINFGTLPQGSTAEQKMIFTSQKVQKINLFISGNIYQYVSFSKNHFITKDNISKDTSLVLSLPLDIKKGTYSGKLIIIITNF